MSSKNVIVWNVRGLNARARRNSAREFVVQDRVPLLCLQETKMVDVPTALVNEMLGPLFDYCFLPSLGLSGRIAMAWRTDIWSMENVSVQRFSVTAKATMKNVAGGPWWITVVYAPRATTTRRCSRTLLSLSAPRALALGSYVVS